MFGRGKKLIAVVFYPGMAALDVVGSMEAMIWLHVNSPYRLITVGAVTEPVRTDTPLKLVPKRRFDEVPVPFGLIVPGGDAAITASQDETLRGYVRSAGEQAELVASIGTGSLILADAGLLRGREATTHWRRAARLEERGARSVRRRWVEDGKIIMAAGVSAGIDMALFLVAKLTDEETMRRVQLDLEYDPQPPLGGIDWDRLGIVPRAVRGGISLLAPLMTRRPRRLTAAAGWN